MGTLHIGSFGALLEHVECEYIPGLPTPLGTMMSHGIICKWWWYLYGKTWPQICLALCGEK